MTIDLAPITAAMRAIEADAVRCGYGHGAHATLTLSLERGAPWVAYLWSGRNADYLSAIADTPEAALAALAAKLAEIDPAKREAEGWATLGVERVT